MNSSHTHDPLVAQFSWRTAFKQYNCLRHPGPVLPTGLHVSRMFCEQPQDGLDGPFNRLLSTFAKQCMVAQLANAAGIDQKDYLSGLLGSERKLATVDATRLRTVLEEAATRARWGRPLAKRKAQGIAVHYMAIAIDVEVKDDGGLIIHEVVIAADAGTQNTPGRIRSQLQGSCFMGLSLALSNDISHINGGTLFAGTDAPEWSSSSLTIKRFAVHLINSRGSLDCLASPSLSAIAPALCNAIFNATHKRISGLPIGSQLNNWRASL